MRLSLPVANLPALQGLDAAAWLLSKFLPERTVEIRVPVPGLSHRQWVDFVKLCSVGDPSSVTESHRFGVFELTVRRLCDLGVMSKPRLQRQVWHGTWTRPKSHEEFAQNPMLQYLLFAESMRLYAEDGAVRAYVGYAVDGEPVTLSGALVVAHRAGAPGMFSWMTSPRDRIKFSRNTTSFFERANNLF